MAGLLLRQEPALVAVRAWPDALEFQEAAQNPGATLRAPELADCRVRLDRLGLPLAYTGRFAVVFRANTPDGREWAARCFTTPGDRSRADRFAAIHRAFQTAAPELRSCIAPFRFVSNGIRVGGMDYPLLVMPWVAGVPLGQWVERNRANPGALLRLCIALSDLLTRLEAHGIAHGDWQHDNLLISENGASITLVDYDGVYVPDLAGKPPGERGHPNYQHPARGDADYGPNLDRFPCLLIQTALVAIACDPSVWNTSRDGENLLFRRDDLVSPGESPVFAALREVAYRSKVLPALLDALDHACRTTEAPPIWNEAAFVAAARELRVELVAEVPLMQRARIAEPAWTPAEIQAETYMCAAESALQVTQSASPATQMPQQVSRTTPWSVLAKARGFQQVSTSRTPRPHAGERRIHRCGTYAALTASIALPWLYAGDNHVEFSVVLCVLVMVISLYLWVRNQELLKIQETDRLLQEAKSLLETDYAAQGAINSRPENRSVVAFVRAALQAKTLALISDEAGMVPFERNLFARAGISDLGDVQPGLHIPHLRPGLVDSVVALRVAVTAEAHAAYEALSDRRRELQRDIMRQEDECAEMLRIHQDLARQATGSDVGFGRFLVYLCGG